jgi:hypothetical protein
MKARVLFVTAACWLPLAFPATAGADGVVPPTRYQYVEPPAFFAAGNTKPQPVTVRVPLSARGSDAAGVATPDGQFVIDLAAGAIAPHAGATSVAIHVTPLAPGSRSALPNGLRANGNAYRVEMNYEPVGGAVNAVAKPGTLLIEVPELGAGVFVSTAANVWTNAGARTVGPQERAYSAQFANNATYLAGTNLPELAAATSSSDSHTALIAGIAIGVVVLVVGAWLLLRRRRGAAT